MAVWRAHHLTEILRECWDAGVLLSGANAGSLCAFTYRSMIADRTIPAGYAGDDGISLHYIETDLCEAVSIPEGKHAWWVEPSEGGGDAEKSIEARLI